MRSAVRITLTYIVIASLWIIFSDRLLSMATANPLVMTLYASIKGLAFVVVTGSILYLQVHREIEIRNAAINSRDHELEIREELIRELHHRIKNNMQVVIGLINIEGRNIEGMEGLKDRISSKLISMMSVFNIVYDIRDMSSISLDRVFEEYARINMRSIRYAAGPSQETYSVETITSIMLVIDSLIESYFSGRESLNVIAISSPERGIVRIEYSADLDDHSMSARNDDEELIDIQLRAISGRLEFDFPSKTIEIAFQDRN